MVVRVFRWLSPMILVGAGALVALVATAASEPAGRQPELLQSHVVSWDQARQRVADWGEMRFYFTGQTRGTEQVLAVVAVVQPGQAVHRAHRHAAEEYLLLVEGSGTWSLAGKESPARRGDMLYVEPWVYHGLTNTGDEPLVFAVIRYQSKGVPAPPRPDDGPDEL